MRKELVLLLLSTAAVFGQNSGPGRIAGKVVDERTGAPLAGVRIDVVLISSAATFRDVRTGEGGRFEIPNLPPGAYLMTGNTLGYSLQSFEQHGDFSTSVVVGPGLDTEHLVFRLRPDSWISGTITDTNGEPAERTRVWLFKQDAVMGRNGIRQIREALIDDRGSFEFGRLEPGAYFLAGTGLPWFSRAAVSLCTPSSPPQGLDAAFADAIQREESCLDVAYPPTFYPPGSSTHGAAPLLLRPGTHATADLRFAAVPSAHARIASKEKNWKNWELVLFSKVLGGNLISLPLNTHLSPSGEIDIDGVVPGNYVVAVERPFLDHFFRVPKPGDLNRTVELSRDSSIEIEDRHALASLLGSVLFPPGERDPDTLFGVVNLQTQEILSFHQMPGDVYELSGRPLTPGAYAITVLGAPRYAVESVEATGAEVTGRTLRISDGIPVKFKVKLSLASAEILGTVTHRGKPASGTMVVLVPEDPENNLSLFRRDQSNSDGSFTLSNVFPGQYLAIAIRDWDTAWADPAALKRYLRKALPVHIGADEKVRIALQVQ